MKLRLSPRARLALHALAQPVPRDLARPFLVASLLATHAFAAPTGGTVVSGSGSISTQGSTTTVTQNSSRLSLNWTSFDIAASETVRFDQPSASAIAVNRIADLNGTRILGALQANGRVFLINPHGVLFGSTARVDVGGLVASTLDLADADLDGDTRRFAGSGSAGVINQGAITAASGGYVALLGATVANTGTISAPDGTIALGAGDRVTLDFAGDRLLSLSVSAHTLAAQASNGGLLRADGGRVLLSAGARDSLVASVVNNTGVIEARTVENRDGTIVLLGGMRAGAVNLTGTLDASAPAGGNGGFVETSAADVRIADTALVTTFASGGQTGTWLIDPVDYVICPSGGNQSGAQLSASLASGSVVITNPNGAGNGDIFVNDAVSWSANTLTLSAHRDIFLNAPLTGTGTASLALEYGQGAVAAGNTADYHVDAPVTLPAGPHFSTKLGSDGTRLDYTVITQLGAAGSTTATDLQGINGNLAGLYALGADIDASGTAAWNAGAGFFPLGRGSHQFLGTFAGLGHTVTGLTINRPSQNFVGLFGFVGSGSTIRDTGLLAVDITGSQVVGGLVGINYAAVANVYSSGSVSGYVSVPGSGGHVGGVVGYNFGPITNAYSSGSVSGSSRVGGFVGENAASITNAYSSSSVSASDAASSSGSAANLVGGFVGSNESFGNITNAYSSGSVFGFRAVGGFVGFNNATISNAYSSGSVSASDFFGGFAGSTANAGTITNSYWDITTSGLATSEGAGIGLTSAQARNAADKAANYAGFDFNSVWWMGADLRPMLRFEHSTTIRTLNQLQLMASDLGATYTLATDLDASPTKGTNASGIWGEAGFSPIGSAPTPFTGTFDGQGHTVTGLTINRPTQPDVGFFGYTSSGSVLRDVGLLAVDVTGGNYVGGVVGYNGGVITHAHSSGSVSGSTLVGGFVGSTFGTITNAYSSGSVSGSGDFVGGFVGQNVGTTTNAYSSSSVSSSSGFVGGFVGGNYRTIANAYSSGSVSGTTLVGGFVGYNVATITNTYSSGFVSGSGAVGGFAGSNAATITNGYWDTTTSGLTTSAGGIGLTGAEARNFIEKEIHYVGFDFNSVWWMGRDLRPMLRFEHSTTIRTLNQLQLMASDLGATYILAADLDASPTKGTNPSGIWGPAGFSPIGDLFNSFTGAFDGQGHTVTGLTIYRPDRNSIGLFGHTIPGSVLRNVGLLAFNITGQNRVGGFVGFNDSTITNVYSSGSVSGASLVGGFVGRNFGPITNAYSSGSVSGSDYVGGFVGSNGAFSSDMGTITNAYSSGSVSGSAYVGGFAGENEADNSGTATISNTYSSSSVSGFSAVGGFVGHNFGIITHAYSTGSVSGASRVGGFGGINDSTNATISDAHSTGSVSSSGNSVGGFIGENLNLATITDAYSSGSVSGTEFGVAQVGGFVGLNEATITNAYSSSSVTGFFAVGGFAGLNRSQATITNAYSSGRTSGVAQIGGFVGDNAATITNAYSSSEVVASGDVGGFAGSNAAIITNAYSSGPVSGVDTFGGFVGRNLSTATISNTYSSSSVTGGFSSVGGFVGQNFAVITRSYWDTTTSGQAASAGATGLTTAQFQLASFLGESGWDASVWAPSSAGYYPELYALTPVARYTGTQVYGDSSGQTSLLHGGPAAYVFGPAGDSLATPSFTYQPGTAAGPVVLGALSGTQASTEGVTYRIIGDLIVTPRPVTVTAANPSRLYGDANPALTYSVTTGNLVNSDTFSGSLATTATPTTGIGAYDITQGDLALSSNYILTFLDGSLTIAARPVTVTAANSSRLYGDANPALTYSVTIGSLANSDTFSGSLATAATASTGVGAYDITQGDLSLGSNYDLTFLDGSLTITPRPVTVTAANPSRLYGDANPALTYSVTIGSLANSDTFSGSLATAATASTGVGAYDITQGDLSLGSNYTLSFLDGSLTIAPRPVTVTAANPSRLYGDANPALTYSVTIGNLANSDTFSGSLATAATASTGVGAYDITSGDLSLSSNYDLTFVDGSLTITPRPVTVTADDKSKPLGVATPPLTYQVTAGNLVGADTFTGTLATTASAASPAGLYAIAQGTLTISENYDLTFVSGALTVDARPVALENAISATRADSEPWTRLTATLPALKLDIRPLPLPPTLDVADL